MGVSSYGCCFIRGIEARSIGPLLEKCLSKAYKKRYGRSNVILTVSNVRGRSVMSQNVDQINQIVGV